MNLGSYFRPPFPLFFVIANKVKQSQELLDSRNNKK